MQIKQSAKRNRSAESLPRTAGTLLRRLSVIHTSVIVDNTLKDHRQGSGYGFRRSPRPRRRAAGSAPNRLDPQPGDGGRSAQKADAPAEGSDRQNRAPAP